MTTLALGYDQLAHDATAALRGRFGENATIDTAQVKDGKVLLVLVSPQLNGKTPKQRQAVVWDALTDALGDKVAMVSLAMAYGTDELM